jgi:hypothetical protein
VERTYYWVLGDTRKFSTKVQGAIMGYYLSEEEATRDAELKFGLDNFRVFPLTTINRPEAARRIRKIILDETNSIDQAFKRFSHQERNMEVN